MNKILNIPKLNEFTVEELHNQLENKVIDKAFLENYIVTRDRVYNELIDALKERENKLVKLKEYIEEHNLYYRDSTGGFVTCDNELLALIESVE